MGPPILVGGDLREAPDVPCTGFPALARTRDTVVPRGRLVVVGDSPTRSWDSRQLGYVASDRVRGVVVRSLAGEQVTTSPAVR